MIDCIYNHHLIRRRMKIKELLYQKYQLQQNLLSERKILHLIVKKVVVFVMLSLIEVYHQRIMLQPVIVLHHITMLIPLTTIMSIIIMQQQRLRRQRQMQQCLRYLTFMVEMVFYHSKIH